MPVAAPSAAFDLTTVAQVQALATVAKADVDSGLIQALITSLSRMVITATGRRALNTVQVGLIDVLDGDGTDRLLLRDYPIKNVTAVTILGQAIAASPDGVAGGWVHDDRAIILLPGITMGWFSSVFPYGRRNVSVTYDAGHDATTDPPGNPDYNGAPDDLGQAVTELVVLQYKRRDWVDQASKNLAAGETIQFRDWQWPPMVEAVINQYDRAPWGL